MNFTQQCAYHSAGSIYPELLLPESLFTKSDAIGIITTYKSLQHGGIVNNH